MVNTHLEDYINNLYHRLSIYEPHQLRIDTIADKLELEVIYGNVTFMLFDTVILERSNQRREWQAFGHEVCHFLRHHGNQLMMADMFVQLQEYQADHFAYHFCVPTFMLDRIENLSVYEITNLFNVELDFAFRRLELYQNKIIQGVEVNAL